jgi:hypothetical protein
MAHPASINGITIFSGTAPIRGASEGNTVQSSKAMIQDPVNWSGNGVGAPRLDAQ